MPLRNLLGASLSLWLAGCAEHRDEAPSTATYGAATNAPSSEIARAWPDRSAEQPWTNGQLAVVQTELSPVTLYRSPSPKLSFFTRMPETGVGGPTFVCISTEQGPKIFAPGQPIDPKRMKESWFVVWFAGATNWTNWDSPWLLSLQHRPTKIRFDADGLHFTFNGAAGYAALMPMYGSYKPEQLAQHDQPYYKAREKKQRVLTWEWHKALPADPLSRARYWASVMRELPVYAEDSFSVDRAHDRVTFRQKFRWLSWDDDWNTKHLKLAPVSPVLALAYREGFPAEFSEKPFDMEILTPYGPYYGVQGVEAYEVTLPVLRYVNETAGVGEMAAMKGRIPYFEAWQAAHASGDWEALRARWPVMRDAFRLRAGGHWAAFALANDTPPLAQAADALGAARIAYRLGDMDTYTDASQTFARALTQLAAQQRGLKYFREWQPWQSMEPLATNSALAVVTASGWVINQAAVANAPAGAPDLARIWRDALPPVREQPSGASSNRDERLIPGGAPSPFVAGAERAVSEPHFQLVQHIIVESPDRNARDARISWPRLSWSDWKTPPGRPWNFGQVRTSTKAPADLQTFLLNWNTRVLVYSDP